MGSVRDVWKPEEHGLEKEFRLINFTGLKG
jgi:hypothetical protein